MRATHRRTSCGPATSSRVLPASDALGSAAGRHDFCLFPAGLCNTPVPIHTSHDCNRPTDAQEAQERWSMKHMASGRSDQRAGSPLILSETLTNGSRASRFPSPRGLAGKDWRHLAEIGWQRSIQMKFKDIRRESATLSTVL